MRDAGAHPQRDSRSATANALDSSIRRSSASCAPDALRALPHLAGGPCDPREVVDAVGLEPLEHRVAVPRVEDRARSPAHGASRCQTHAEAEERRHDREAHASPRSATKSSTAVSTPFAGPPSRAAERG